MMMKYLLTLFLGICLFSFSSKAQDRLVQFSGVIYKSDTNAVVPYVNITNKTQRRQSLSANYQGYFSFVAHEGDTIVFSSVGYRKEAIVIPSNLLDKRYTVIMKMQIESVKLPVVTIYPWASLEQFNREFMTLKLADDDLEIAKKNTSRDRLLAAAQTLPRDAGEMGTLNFQNNHISLSNKNINQKGANQLLNPFAWGALMNQIFQGDKSRGSED